MTVSACVTLTQDQLEAEPYNLIYDDSTDTYYTKNSDGDTVPVGTTDVNAVTWEKALQAMSGLEDVSSVTVTGDGSDRTISFTVDLETNQDSSWNGSGFGVTLTYPDDEEAILEQVFNLESGDGVNYAISYIAPNGYAQITATETNSGYELVFDVDTGYFSYIGSQNNDSVTLDFNTSASTLTGDTVSLTHFEDIDIDFSSVSMYNNGGTSTVTATSGANDGYSTGSGRKLGEMTGIEVGSDGKITATYDNGVTKLLGQIVVANFANASGLAKAGDNLYSTTMNSGEFDGVGEDITASGGTMTSGVLEMSNVDLSSEFTEMITTQRGFQANSRIITVSDSMLEELVNLKR